MNADNVAIILPLRELLRPKDTPPSAAADIEKILTNPPQERPAKGKRQEAQQAGPAMMKRTKKQTLPDGTVNEIVEEVPLEAARSSGQQSSVPASGVAPFSGVGHRLPEPPPQMASTDKSDGQPVMPGVVWGHGSRGWCLQRVVCQPRTSGFRDVIDLPSA